jgi:hypothetical protein
MCYTCYMCSVSGLFRRFGRTFCLYFQGDWIYSGECFSISQPEDRRSKALQNVEEFVSLYDVKNPKIDHYTHQKL